MNETNLQTSLAEKFLSEFSLKKQSIHNSIENLIASAPSEINEQLTCISNDIQYLSKALHDSTIFLPSYSVKVRQNELRDLESLLKEKEDLLIPKKKFGFRSTFKPKTDNYQQTRPKDAVESENTSTAVYTETDANFFTVEALNDVNIIYEATQLNGNDVLLRNLSGSSLCLIGSPSTLRIVNLSGCKVLCGPVKTSIFIEGCKDCTFYLCCQQLRTHSSEKIDVYLRVSSRAIIEDCHKVRFAPYTWNHPMSEELHIAAGIDSTLERFDAVDDFGWLSSSKSPNWEVIPLEERIDFS